MVLVEGLAGVSTTRVPSWYISTGKRLLDVVLAGAGLVVLSPLLLATAAIVRVSLGRPILFRQVRPGLHSKPFTLVKFRTMRVVAPGAGDPVADEPRLTAVGRVLRALSLDELPELWNVLRGEMSLVGPRPLLMEYLPLYSPEQARRHEVRPGLTGLAQVSGRNLVGWPERLAFDVWYVDHVSLPLDLRIMAKTVAAVVMRQGVSAADHATMPRFTGDSVPPAATMKQQ